MHFSEFENVAQHATVVVTAFDICLVLPIGDDNEEKVFFWYANNYDLLMKLPTCLYTRK